MLSSMILLCALLSVQGVSGLKVNANPNYALLQGLQNVTLPFSGEGFEDYEVSVTFQGELTFDGANPSVRYQAVVVSDTEAYLLAIDVPSAASNQLVRITLYNNNQVVYVSQQVIATTIIDIHQSIVAEPCDNTLVQNIEVGQTLVGQSVAPNSWNYYMWSVDDQTPYLGESYTIGVIAKDPINGIFIRYTSFEENQACPNYTCNILTDFPFNAWAPCDFDARLLTCDEIKFPPGEWQNAFSPECSRPNDPMGYSIISKLTKNGRYIIGIQGRGGMPPDDLRFGLGYCTSCDGLSANMSVSYTISLNPGTLVVSSASTIFYSPLLFFAILFVLFLI